MRFWLTQPLVAGMMLCLPVTAMLAFACKRDRTAPPSRDETASSPQKKANRPATNPVTWSAHLRRLPRPGGTVVGISARDFRKTSAWSRLPKILSRYAGSGAVVGSCFSSLVSRMDVAVATRYALTATGAWQQSEVESCLSTAGHERILRQLPILDKTLTYWPTAHTLLVHRGPFLYARDRKDLPVIRSLAADATLQNIIKQFSKAAVAWSVDTGGGALVVTRPAADGGVHMTVGAPGVPHDALLHNYWYLTAEPELAAYSVYRLQSEKVARAFLALVGTLRSFLTDGVVRNRTVKVAGGQITVRERLREDQLDLILEQTLLHLVKLVTPQH